MFLGALLVFLLSRTLAHPIPEPLPPANPVPPSSPVLTAFVAVSDCIRDPSRIRSTSELVWNCLGTVFVCTYVAIHHNMPDRNASKKQRMWEKLSMSIYTLLVPEAIIMHAMSQRFVASRIVERFRRHGWTMTHAYFVIMGGLMREDGNEFKVVTIDEHGNPQLGGQTIKEGIIFPTISEEEIQDKAKGDLLSKLVVVVQTLWFVVQLELVTLAFATLNIVTYFVWWNKPLNAEYPISFKKDGSRTSGPIKIPKNNLGVSDRYMGLWIGWTGRQKEQKDSIWMRIKKDMSRKSFLGLLWKWLLKKPFNAIFFPLGEMAGMEEVSNSTSVGSKYTGPIPEGEGLRNFFLPILIGVLFGGIHVFGWNFEFSTNFERDIWRASSIIVTVEPILITCGIAIAVSLENDDDASVVLQYVKIAMVSVLLIIGIVAYTFARIALLVLPLFALRNLPSSAFQNVKWADYIPHI
ncbi:hypothetical protein AX16_007388 [Volvariella volvacea WC 439]|nr:hypothetical protein AX16_007388 [Volvariella volvacea WC 439]